MSEKICGIYKITSPSGKVYIGQSIDILKRIRHYKSLFNCSTQTRLYRSFLKYGTKKHIFEIIEKCGVDELNKRERYWQEYHDVIGPLGLNCVLTATSEKKMIHREETKIKISLQNKGRLSGDKNPMFGKTHSEEAKKKISETHKGRKLTDDHKAKIYIGGWSKGIPMSDKQKKLISEKNKGRVCSYETRIKMRESLSKKVVIDKDTGVFFMSCNEAADCYNINRSTLFYYLSGKRPNKTRLIYA